MDSRILEPRTLFTVREVAELLRVSPSCVYALIDDAQLRCVRLPPSRRAIRIEATELLDFVESKKILRRREVVSKKETSAPSAFVYLDASTLQKAWAERDASPPN